MNFPTLTALNGAVRQTSLRSQKVTIGVAEDATKIAHL